MDDTFKARYLLAGELDYELRIRGIVTKRGSDDKRRLLQRSVDKDIGRPLELILAYKDPQFDYEQEVESINSTIDSIKQLMPEFEGSPQDALFKRLRTRIAHATLRVLRIKIPDNLSEHDAKEMVEFRNESHATCALLEAELYDKVETTASPQVSSPVAPVIFPSVVPSLPLVVNTKLVPIYKWGISFSGEAQGVGVNQFLERVDELCQARHATKDDLYNSAVDLFSGKALLWYRAVRHKYVDWDSLVNAIKQEFLPSDCDDILWDDIKNRMQSKGESISIYVAVMETLFSRLSRAPLEITKIKVIQKNLGLAYLNHLEIAEAKTLDELIRIGKKIEQMLSLRQRSKVPCRQSCLLEAELAGVQTQPVRDTFKEKSSNEKISNFVVPSRADVQPFGEGEVKQGKEDPRKTLLICWNCRQPNHSYRNCVAKRVKFCYKCGLRNVTVASCPKCRSGNE
ncbi:uncharacterized protein LOC135133067 [Zophobas morio]|uniref:uncharacterized protein LOC135133067 n=1 Tax=Zophobas morio TaxID=2755281 RepID=UPI003083EBBC